MFIKRIDHACFVICADGKRIVTDPFSTDRLAALKDKELIAPDIVLISHAHSDHMALLNDIAGKNTVVIAIVELAGYLSEKGFKAIGMNIGGEIKIGNIRIAMTTALHSSSVTENGKSLCLGPATGFIIRGENHSVYFAGDTDMSADMSVINDFYHPDVAILPVGGHYTMDVDKAAFVCNRLMELKTVIPMHYDTFPAIKADLTKLKSEVKRGEVVVLDKSEKYFLA